MDLRPNAGTAAEAEKGLRWYEEGLGGEGLVEGTIRDARKMAAREPLSEDKVRRMPAWFARHEPDLQSPANSDPENDDYPGPGRVAWALWGGDAGRTWAERKVSQMESDAERQLEREHKELLDQIASHLDAARLALAAMADEYAEEEEEEVGEVEEEGRAQTLEVEKRDGSTVQLRSATGQVRTVQLPEQRNMTAPITVDEDQDAETPAPVFRGHAAVFDRESEDLGGFREVIARGAFRRALDANQDTVALFNHDPNYVLGRTTNNTLDLREDPRGLHAYFQAPDTQYARDIREIVKRGDVSQMSFAFTVARDDWQEREDGTILRRVLEVGRLHDVSLVTTPAYPQTDAQAVRDHTDLTSEPEPTSEPHREADTGDEAREAREAFQRELLEESKRRLTLAQAKTRQKG
jgi:HK97 family phage prohead protease